MLHRSQRRLHRCRSATFARPAYSALRLCCMQQSASPARTLVSLPHYVNVPDQGTRFQVRIPTVQVQWKTKYGVGVSLNGDTACWALGGGTYTTNLMSGCYTASLLQGDPASTTLSRARIVTERPIELSCGSDTYLYGAEQDLITCSLRVRTTRYPDHRREAARSGRLWHKTSFTSTYWTGTWSSSW